MCRACFLSMVLLGTILARGESAPQKAGYHARVSVAGPTRLDWTFVVATQSLAKPPASWLGEFDSTKQAYELFVPARKNPKAALPMILFISPGDGPSGWKSLEKLARSQGILFASPHEAGNNCPPRKRIRIVLDILDDLRRNYSIDPDRTYIAGLSGGGRMACAVGFALPELFGGVMPICASGNLRDESWLRQRAVERLSVALLTGEKDFNRGEVERLRGPFLKEVGVRARVWTQAGLGHAIPNEKTLAETFRWLEEGLPKRQALAKKYPSSRLGATQDSARLPLATALFTEGKKRLGEKGQLYTGLMQIKGVSERWPDTAPGKQARALLEEYDNKSDKPWEKDDLAEQRRFVLASARSLTAYGTGPLDGRYEMMRPAMLRQALKLWQQIADDQPDNKEARGQIAALEKRLDSTRR